MAEPVRMVHGRSARPLPRGVVIVALALLSWAVLVGLWQALALSFAFVAGM